MRPGRKAKAESIKEKDSKNSRSKKVSSKKDPNEPTKKRGRPPKNDKESPKKRGRPRKNDKDQADNTKKSKKKKPETLEKLIEVEKLLGLDSSDTDTELCVSCQNKKVTNFKFMVPEYKYTPIQIHSVSLEEINKLVRMIKKSFFYESMVKEGDNTYSEEKYFRLDNLEKPLSWEQFHEQIARNKKTTIPFKKWYFNKEKNELELFKVNRDQSYLLSPVFKKIDNKDDRDSKRLQITHFLYQNNPLYSSQAFSKTLESISKTVIDFAKSFDDGFDTAICSILISLPGDVDQDLHVDDVRDVPKDDMLSCIVSLTPGSKLYLAKRYNYFGKNPQSKIKIEIHQGAGAIFSGTTIHAGCGYTTMNIRLHYYILKTKNVETWDTFSRNQRELHLYCGHCGNFSTPDDASGRNRLQRHQKKCAKKFDNEDHKMPAIGKSTKERTDTLEVESDKDGGNNEDRKLPATGNSTYKEIDNVEQVETEKEGNNGDTKEVENDDQDDVVKEIEKRFNLFEALGLFDDNWVKYDTKESIRNVINSIQYKDGVHRDRSQKEKDLNEAFAVVELFQRPSIVDGTIDLSDGGFRVGDDRTNLNSSLIKRCLVAETGTWENVYAQRIKEALDKKILEVEMKQIHDLADVMSQRMFEMFGFDHLNDYGKSAYYALWCMVPDILLSGISLWSDVMWNTLDRFSHHSKSSFDKISEELFFEGSHQMYFTWNDLKNCVLPKRK